MNCSGFRDTPIPTSTELPSFEEQNNNLLLHINILIIISLIFVVINVLLILYIVIEFILRRINIHRGQTLLIEEGQPPEFSI